MDKNTNDILKGSNVTIDELSKFISKSGVIVKPHIGRIRKKVTLPKELLGTVSTEVDEDNEFFKEYITQGTLNLIPKTDEKKLVSLETCVRSQVNKLSIACDGTFMIADVYANEYLPYFNKKKVEYFNKRDEIVAKYDVLIDIFKTKLEAFLDRRNIKNKNDIIKNVMSTVPDKQTFADSFYMEVKLTAFPVEENIDMFSSTLASQVKQSISETKLDFVKEMIGSLLAESFNGINKMLLYYRDNSIIKQQQITPLINIKKKLIKNNILDLDLIKDIISEFTTLEKIDLDSSDDVAEQAEIIMTKAYGFLKDTELDEFIDTNMELAISEMDLARMYSIMNPNSVVAKSIVNMEEAI